jgi:hypothetical protein
MYPSHPEWKKDKLIQTALKHDLKKLREKYGARGIGKLLAITQSGMSVSEFTKLALEWSNNDRHPVTGKLYKEMVYQPMLELIGYFQDNDFQVYVVSGGDLDFMRSWGVDVYGIPRENFIGTIQKLEYKKVGGKPVLMRSPEFLIANNAGEKAVMIHNIIGRKPVIAIGNSDGDIQMLEYCESNSYPSLQAFVHHTDTKREWSYDRNSHVGKLSKGLYLAKSRNWLLIDMKNDWNRIYKTENK